MNRIILILSVLIHSSFANPFYAQNLVLTASKLWISTCRLSNCQNALEMCVNDGCLGKAMCHACIQEHSSECLRCVDEILNESEDLLGTNRPTIFCDAANRLHQLACSYFCRTNYKTQSECVVINDLPVCKCGVDSPSSTASVTTNKPISYPCNQFYFIFINFGLFTCLLIIKTFLAATRIMFTR